MWFYIKGGKQLGPVSDSQLLRLKKRGELEPDDLLWFDGIQEWRPARELHSLKFSSPDLSSPAEETKETQ